MPILSVQPIVKTAADPFRFDPNSTENEGRWRLIDPKVFNQNTIRRWRVWKGIKAPGVQFVMGMDTRDKKWKPQAIRFDKGTWTEDTAAKWWNEYKNEFEKEWTQADWEPWILKHPDEVFPGYKTAAKQEDIDKLFSEDIPLPTEEPIEDQGLPETYEATQCAWCKRYMDKDETKYIEKPIGYKVVSHNICPECSQKLLGELSTTASIVKFAINRRDFFDFYGLAFLPSAKVPDKRSPTYREDIAEHFDVIVDRAEIIDKLARQYKQDIAPQITGEFKNHTDSSGVYGMLLEEIDSLRGKVSEPTLRLLRDLVIAADNHLLTADEIKRLDPTHEWMPDTPISVNNLVRSLQNEWAKLWIEHKDVLSDTTRDDLFRGQILAKVDSLESRIADVSNIAEQDKWEQIASTDVPIQDYPVLFSELPWTSVYGGSRWASIADQYSTLDKNIERLENITNGQPVTDETIQQVLSTSGIEDILNPIANSIDDLNSAIHNTSALAEDIEMWMLYGLTAVSAGVNDPIVLREMSPVIRKEVVEEYRGLLESDPQSFYSNFTTRFLKLPSVKAQGYVLGFIEDPGLASYMQSFLQDNIKDYPVGDYERLQKVLEMSPGYMQELPETGASIVYNPSSEHPYSVSREPYEYDIYYDTEQEVRQALSYLDSDTIEDLLVEAYINYKDQKSVSEEPIIEEDEDKTQEEPPLETESAIQVEAISGYCADCGKYSTYLQKHRMKRGYEGGEYTPKNIALLCPKCHKKEHSEAGEYQMGGEWKHEKLRKELGEEEYSKWQAERGKEKQKKVKEELGEEGYSKRQREIALQRWHPKRKKSMLDYDMTSDLSEECNIIENGAYGLFSESELDTSETTTSSSTQEDLVKQVQFLADLFEGFPWRLEGSVNLLLQGVPTNVRDLDITTNEEGLVLITEKLSQVGIPFATDVSSYGNRLSFNLTGWEVEVIAGEPKLQMLDKVQYIGNMPILPLEDAQHFYELIDRDEKVNLIDKFLKDEGVEKTSQYVYDPEKSLLLDTLNPMEEEGKPPDYPDPAYWGYPDTLIKKKKLKRIKYPVEASVLDYPKNSLDPLIWYYEEGSDLPKLQSSIKNTIVSKFIDWIRSQDINISSDLWLKTMLFVGSTATTQWKETSDIDIDVVIDEEVLSKVVPMNMAAGGAAASWIGMRAAATLNGYKIGAHPVNYWVRPDDQPIESADAIYDLFKDIWIKSPPKVPSTYDPEALFRDAWDKAKAWAVNFDAGFGEVKRLAEDYLDLQENLLAAPDDLKDSIIAHINRKIIELDLSVRSLLDDYKAIALKRRQVFESTEDLQQQDRLYFSRNWADAALVYKWLEKYKYIDLIKKIYHIYREEPESTITIDKVRHLMEVLT